MADRGTCLDQRGQVFLIFSGKGILDDRDARNLSERLLCVLTGLAAGFVHEGENFSDMHDGPGACCPANTLH